MKFTCSLFLLVTLLVVASWGAPPEDKDSDWEEFKKEHKKAYKISEKESKARANFHATDAKIKKHNAEYNAGNVSWFMRHNQFSDMDDTEFEQVMLRPLPAANASLPGMHTVPLIGTNSSTEDRQLYPSVDYSTVRYMAVRDQGLVCGVCYSFASVGLVEWYYSLKYGRYADFSEQQIVSCSYGYGNNNGCFGGRIDNTLWYLKNNGLALESANPYQQLYTTTAAPCVSAWRAVSLFDYYGYPAYQETSNDAGLMNALRSANGPVAIHIYAPPNWKSYGGAVYADFCSGPINHAVMIIGYGTKDGKPYWHVKNSWGTTWGAGGYMYLLRGRNQCNILSDYAWWPVIA